MLLTSRTSPSLITVEIILIMVTNFFWLLLVFVMIAKNKKNQKIGKVVVVRSQKTMHQPFRPRIFFSAYRGGMLFFGRAGPPLSLFSENFRFLQSSRKTKSNQKKLVTMINIFSTPIRVGLLLHVWEMG